MQPKRRIRTLLKLFVQKFFKGSAGGALKETVKRQLVDECVAAVLKELESKFDY